MYSLLSIVEEGGYPDFSSLYRACGFHVVTETRMRSAIGYLKRHTPDVIVAEFNFQSDFRDRTSSLESLLAVVQRLPATRVIVLYDREYKSQFAQLQARLPVHCGLEFPVAEENLRDALMEIAGVSDSTGSATRSGRL